jgi:N-acyl-D-amino-acid deacylase
MFDLLIKGGTVVDGTGAPPYAADVAITGHRIVKIIRRGEETPPAPNSAGPSDRPAPPAPPASSSDGPPEAPPPAAARVIDAVGRVVCPGFVDTHSHSDLTLPVHNQAWSSLSQGITTELVGNCGWSLAPVKAETRESVLARLCSGLAGRETYEATDWSWHSVGEYMEALDRRGIGVNVAVLVGQSLLRAHVVGTEKRDATREEMAAMKAILEQALIEGAHGLSTGRSYLPGAHAGTAEIIELTEVVAAYDGIYTSHIKDEGDGLVDSVREVIEIGRAAGCKAQVSHHKAMGPRAFGRVRETLTLMEEARAGGIDVMPDTYPFHYSQAYNAAYALVPREFDGLTPPELLVELRKPEIRAKVRAHVEQDEHGLTARAPNYLLVQCPKHPEYNWLPVVDAAAGRDIFDFMYDLLLEEEMKVICAGRMCEDDVRTAIAHPLTMISTDAFAVDRPVSAPLHPRHFGTFPRVLGKYVREEKVLTLEAAVHKMTGLPAARIGLLGRGGVAQGNWADLVVFDPATVADAATVENQYATAIGIDYVIVNGRIAVEMGRHQGVPAGRVVRRVG